MRSASLFRSPYSPILARANKGPEQTPPRITSNVKRSLQILKIWKEYREQKSNSPKPATSYRKKKPVKDELPTEDDFYQDLTSTLYYTHQGLETAVPVLLVDGYNVCGYWPKLKKHFSNGRLSIARQKLIDELSTFSVIRGETEADAWIEKEVVALKEDGCPKVWVVTSDTLQQHAAHGAGAFVWSSKALVSEIKASQKELDQMLREHRSTSMQGKLLHHNLCPEVVSALKDLRAKLLENES